MATSNCEDCTFLQYIPYWLLYYSWHWILLTIYLRWFAASMEPGSRQPPSEYGPRGESVIYWLKKWGHLRSQTDARRLFIFHLILLALEPIEGYWILAGWYHLFLLGASIEVPNKGHWNDHFAKYICTVALVVGIVGWVLAGVYLILYTLLHLHELWTWRPKGESDVD